MEIPVIMVAVGLGALVLWLERERIDISIPSLGRSPYSRLVDDVMAQAEEVGGQLVVPNEITVVAGPGAFMMDDESLRHGLSSEIAKRADEVGALLQSPPQVVVRIIKDREQPPVVHATFSAPTVPMLDSRHGFSTDERPPVVRKVPRQPPKRNAVPEPLNISSARAIDRQPSKVQTFVLKRSFVGQAECQLPLGTYYGLEPSGLLVPLGDYAPHNGRLVLKHVGETGQLVIRVTDHALRVIRNGRMLEVNFWTVLADGDLIELSDGTLSDRWTIRSINR